MLVNHLSLPSQRFVQEKKRVLKYIEEVSEERRLREILRLASSAYFSHSILSTMRSDSRDCRKSPRYRFVRILADSPSAILQDAYDFMWDNGGYQTSSGLNGIRVRHRKITGI